MLKLFKQILILSCLIGLLVLPYFVFAADNMGEVLKKVGKYGGYNPSTTQYSLSQIAGTAIYAFLSILGIIFITLMIYGGYTWMTASGDEEKLRKAQQTIKTAIIGLIIVVGAYAIWNFILYKAIYGTGS